MKQNRTIQQVTKSSVSGSWEQSQPKEATQITSEEDKNYACGGATYSSNSKLSIDDKHYAESVNKIVHFSFKK